MTDYLHGAIGLTRKSWPSCSACCWKIKLLLGADFCGERAPARE